MEVPEIVGCATTGRRVTVAATCIAGSSMVALPLAFVGNRWWGEYEETQRCFC